MYHNNSLISLPSLYISGTERRDTPGVTPDSLPLPTTAATPPTGTTTTGTGTTGKLAALLLRLRLRDLTTGITGTGGTEAPIDMMTRSTLDEVEISIIMIKFSPHLASSSGQARLINGGRDAELTCEFPVGSHIISNIIWERSDRLRSRAWNYNRYNYRE